MFDGGGDIPGEFSNWGSVPGRSIPGGGGGGKGVEFAREEMFRGAGVFTESRQTYGKGLSARDETRCRHYTGNSFRSAARVLL